MYSYANICHVSVQERVLKQCLQNWQDASGPSVYYTLVIDPSTVPLLIMHMHTVNYYKCLMNAIAMVICSVYLDVASYMLICIHTSYSIVLIMC